MIPDLHKYINLIAVRLLVLFSRHLHHRAFSVTVLRSSNQLANFKPPVSPSNNQDEGHLRCRRRYGRCHRPGRR